MGCWNQTCSLTNLPIKYKDKIVVIPLMLTNPNINGITYNINDKCCPICTPIICNYNDYGGIEDVENKDVTLETLKSLKFLFFEKEKEKKYFNIETIEEFFEEILEEKLHIEIDEQIYQVNYLMFHYDLYNKLIYNVSNRKLETKNNKKETFKNLWEKKIKEFVLKVKNQNTNNHYHKKTKEELFEEIENLNKDILFSFSNEEKKKILKDISSPSNHLRISTNYINGYVFDILLRFLICEEEYENLTSNEVLTTILDMIMFEKALYLLRKGYLINTGLGHQGNELKLHIIVNEFINSYIKKEIKKLKEYDYDTNEIDKHLEEYMFWLEN